MGVTADNHIYFGYLTSNFEIVVLNRGIHAHMRKADNQVAILCFQFGDHLAGRLHGVEVGHFTDGLRRRIAIEVHPETENTDFVATALNDNVGFNHFRQFLVGKLVVCAYYGEFGSLEPGGESRTPVVELVVAECGRVIMHGVHQMHLHIAFEDVEIGSSLRKVAGIEQPRIGIFRPNFSDSRLPPQSTAHIDVLLVGIGINLAVRVVRVHDHQRLRL